MDPFPACCLRLLQMRWKARTQAIEDPAQAATEGVHVLARPALSLISRSQRAITAGSWVITSMGMRFLTSARTSQMASGAVASRLEVTSSSASSRAPENRTRAIVLDQRGIAGAARPKDDWAGWGFLDRTIELIIEGMALLLGACSLGRDVPRVQISNLNDASGIVQAPESTEAGWSAVVSDLRNSTVIPTVSGPVIVSGSRDLWGKMDRSSVNQGVSLNPTDGSVRWAATIEQPMESGLRAVHQERLEDEKEDFADPETVAVSPDGKYVAIQLEPYMVNGKAKNIADQRMNTVVLDAETGQEIRTVQVSGLVLGQALTNDSLVVQTAENYFPAGTGTLHIYSLEDARADPATVRADQWLIGATADSVMLAPGKRPKREGVWHRHEDFPYTVTRMSTSGEDLGTLTGVLDVHPGGWVERFSDPAVAIQEPGVKQPRELINVDTKASMDISDMSVDDVILPTGPGLQLERDVWAEQGRVGWMEARAESKDMSGEDMKTIFVDEESGKVGIAVFSMGEK